MSEFRKFSKDVYGFLQPPLSGEGCITPTIANHEYIESLEADIYVAVHDDSGTLADVRAQRILLEGWFQRAEGVLERGNELRCSSGITCR